MGFYIISHILWNFIISSRGRWSQKDLDICRGGTKFHHCINRIGDDSVASSHATCMRCCNYFGLGISKKNRDTVCNEHSESESWCRSHYSIGGLDWDGRSEERRAGTACGVSRSAAC